MAAITDLVHPGTDDIHTFTFAGNEIRALMVDGNPWFVAADVAAALGYRMASDMTRILEDDERGTHAVRTPSGWQEMVVISDPGLYRVVMLRREARSLTPEARDYVKRFQRWVLHEVLPAIRHTGAYAVPAASLPPVPRTFADALQLAADQARELERKDATIAELEPPAQKWNAIVSGYGNLSVADAARVLSEQLGLPALGERRLFAELHRLGWIFRDRGDHKWKPRQDKKEAGLLHARPTGYVDRETGHSVTTGVQVRVTPKGLDRLLALLAQP